MVDQEAADLEEDLAVAASAVAAASVAARAEEALADREGLTALALDSDQDIITAEVGSSDPVITVAVAALADLWAH